MAWEDHYHEETDQYCGPSANPYCAIYSPKCPPMRREAHYCICPRPIQVQWGGEADPAPGPRKFVLIDAAERNAPPPPVTAADRGLPPTLFGRPTRLDSCGRCTGPGDCQVGTPRGMLYGCRYPESTQGAV